MADELEQYNKGKKYFELKDYNKALACFEEAIKINPNCAEAYNERGKTFVMLKDFDRALRSYTIATSFSPDFTEVWMNKADVLMVLGMYEEASRCFDEITRIEPENEKMWLVKGTFMANINLLTSALECFDKALRINPQSAEAKSKRDDTIRRLGGLPPEEQHVKVPRKIEQGLAPKKIEKITKKICLIGDPAVGKTSLIRRYVYNMFDDKYLSTVGARISEKTVRVEQPTPNPDIDMILMIWDIAGQKTFGNVHSTYYMGADAALVACDVTRKDTLDNIHFWIDDIFKIAGKMPIIFIGNKTDLNVRAFKEEEIKAVAQKYNGQYIFTSAKTGEGVEKVFYILCKTLVK